MSINRYLLHSSSAAALLLGALAMACNPTPRGERGRLIITTQPPACEVGTLPPSGHVELRGLNQGVEHSIPLPQRATGTITRELPAELYSTSWYSTGEGSTGTPSGLDILGVRALVAIYPGRVTTLNVRYPAACAERDGIEHKPVLAVR